MKLHRTIKNILKYIPGAMPLAEYLYSEYIAKKLKRMSTEDVFTLIYRYNKWGGESSISGCGSSIEQTKVVRKELPKIFNKFGISSILDIPCGDYFWMDKIDLAKVTYIGADIVFDLVEQNKQKYGNGEISFIHLDILKDNLPQVDLILVRDCLVHFSFKDVFKALKTISCSDSKYLLTSTFVDKETNEDILTGKWRPLNLQRPPFNFPKPIYIVNERHPKTKYKDKSLALWKITNIKDCFEKNAYNNF